MYFQKYYIHVEINCFFKRAFSIENISYMALKTFSLQIYISCEYKSRKIKIHEFTMFGHFILTFQSYFYDVELCYLRTFLPVILKYRGCENNLVLPKIISPCSSLFTVSAIFYKYKTSEYIRVM